MTRSHTFSRASRHLHVFTSSFDWFIGFVRVIRNWPEWLLWFWFYDTQLKTTLLFQITPPVPLLPSSQYLNTLNTLVHRIMLLMHHKWERGCVTVAFDYNILTLVDYWRTCFKCVWMLNPSRKAVPSVMLRSPVNMLNVVVFPAPRNKWLQKHRFWFPLETY